MRVFVAGATGVIGRRVIPRLAAAGHDVDAVARGPQKAAALESQGARPVAVDLFAPAGVVAAVAGHDAVVNLATHIPPSTRMMLASAWEENDRLRREASANLVDAAIAADVGVHVQESVCFVYADHGAAWIDEETAEVDPVPTTASALEAERHAQRLTAAGGRGVALRFAQFVAADSVHMRDLAAIAARGWLPLVGDADGYESYVHADDAAAAVVAALAVPAGVYNVAEDEPLTRAEHAEVWSTVLGRAVRLPPAPLGRLPRMRFRARSLRLSNRRLREVSGWRPMVPSMSDGWPRLVAALEADGDDPS